MAENLEIELNQRSEAGYLLQTLRLLLLLVAALGGGDFVPLPPPLPPLQLLRRHLKKTPPEIKR